ncbi:MAG: hypothetical protein PWP04_1749 [Candidatus Atribacteria bacterium]|nr:hypothetical protein [Candidatus Atribacteria bacterium]
MSHNFSLDTVMVNRKKQPTAFSLLRHREERSGVAISLFIEPQQKLERQLHLLKARDCHVIRKYEARNDRLEGIATSGKNRCLVFRPDRYG